MLCPICGSELYQKDEQTHTHTGEYFISIRCTKPGCNYFNYKNTLIKDTAGTTIKQSINYII